METNIDDCSGEMLGFVMEQLLDQGALDVFFTSIFMKKNRPAYRLTVVCNEEKMGLLQKVIFTQTTTIGIRYRKEQRTVLKRQIKEIETPLGKLQVKEVEIDANAYALCLSNMLHISDNIELRFSVPQEAMDLADPRSRQYYENRPELKRYIDKLKRNAGQPVVRKPERNELCPCGSGKKFKKCCIGKGIYD